MAGTEWKSWYDDIGIAALRRAPAILSEWLPGGSVVRREFQAGSLRGGPGNSLKINLENGRWKDFATGEPGGSNLIALYAAINHLEWKDATDELAKQFAIEKPARQLQAVSTWSPIVPVPEDAPFDDDGNPAFPPLQGEGEIKGAWCYLSADGQPVMWRARVERSDGSKDIMPLTFCANREGVRQWRWKDIASPRLLYGLEWLGAMPEAPILIVEGEKTADAARALLPEWVVLTWPGGTNRISTKHTDWSPVANRKSRIVLWPDADEAGTRAMAQLADILLNRCEVVRPDPSWKKGWDLADGAAEGWGTAQTIEYLEGHLIKPTEAQEDTRPTVEISGGDLKVKSDSVWQAIAATNDPPWLVSTATGIALIDRDVSGHVRRKTDDLDLLRYAVTSRFKFVRRRMVEETVQTVSTTPPDVVLRNLLVNPAAPIPFVRRLTEVPVLAPDGRAIVKPGFDKGSGVYYVPSPDLSDMELDEAPPTPSEVEGALALIDDLIADFPFVEDCDRAHAMAFLLLPVIRLTISGPTPLFRFEAPQARTGKSKLMRLLAQLVCSNVIDISEPNTEEEWKKAITSHLGDEPEAFLIDNATALESAHLKKLLTDTVWGARALGTNDTVRYPVQCVFGCSLNNPVISREIMGRSIRIRIDAGTTRPEARGGFRHPLIEEYRDNNRGRLVEAVLTLARVNAPFVNDLPVLGGFEAFCRRMGSLLTALGIKGFLADRGDESALSDSESALMGFVGAWAREHGDRPTLTRDLVPIAENIEGFDLGKGDSDRGKATALSMFIRKHRGTTVGDWKIGEPSEKRPTMWRLIHANGKTPLQPSEEPAESSLEDENGRW